MKKNKSVLRARNLRDKAILTVEQFKLLNLSTLPKKVRIRVIGQTGAPVQVQHVGRRILMQILTEYLFPPVNRMDAIKALSDIADAALIAAAHLLDTDGSREPIFGRLGNNGIISIWLSDLCTGEQAFDALTDAEKHLIDCADDLLATFPTGIRRTPTQNIVWL